MRKLFLLVFMLAGICSASCYGATVLIDSSKAQSGNQSVIDFFTNNFDDVTVIYGNYNNWADSAVVDAIEAADVLVIARDNSSNNYDDTGDQEFYSGLETPVISLSSYFSRVSRLGWGDGDVTNFSTDGDEAVVTIEGAAVFGAAGSFDWWNASIDFWGAGTDTSVGDGSILVTDSAGNNIVVGWKAGDEIAVGLVQSGNRLLFNLPTGNGLPDTDAGLQAMINAIKHYTFLGNIASPVPGNDDTGVALDITLQWEGAEDKDNAGQLDPAVLKHYVYIDLDNTDDDPNLYLAGEIVVSDWATRNAAYGPLSLSYDQGVSWRIEEGLDDGQGSAYAAGDSHNLMGPVWSFTAIASVPEFELQPQNTYFNTGDSEVSLNLIATTPFTPLSYQWNKDGSVISDGADYSGTQSDTLVVLNPELADEGGYYCTVTGNNGGIADSATVSIKLRRVLAWYQFEQDVNDSVGTNDGTFVGGDFVYSEGMSEISDQNYAVDPNTSNYALLSVDAYPKAGFGNAIEEGSIAFWVKTDSTSEQMLLGSFNDDSTTGFQIISSSGNISIYLRDSDAVSISVAGDTIVNDGEWHYAVVVYQGDSGSGNSFASIYIDGELSGSITGAVMDNFEAWQYPMVLLARNNRGTVDKQFGGMLDDLKIYNYLLSSEDVAELFYNVTGQQSCIVANYVSDLDFNNDCNVDLEDFANIASAWLSSGLYPVLP